MVCQLHPWTASIVLAPQGHHADAAIGCHVRREQAMSSALHVWPGHRMPDAALRAANSDAPFETNIIKTKSSHFMSVSYDL